MPSHADRDSVFIDTDIRRIFKIALVGLIQGDKRLDVALIEVLVQGIVVMGAVPMEAADDIRVIEQLGLLKSEDGRNAVMPGSLYQPEVEWEFTFQDRVMDGNDVLRMAVKPALMVAVPAEAGVGVGEPALTVAVVYALLPAFADLDAVAGAAGVDAGAVARYGQV